MANFKSADKDNTEKYIKATGAGTDVDPMVLARSLEAGENHIGQVNQPRTMVEVTFSLDTSAYADGDVLADVQELASVARVNQGEVVLESLVLLDKDDQGQALDIVFLNANTSLGTENAAVSITDADAEDIIGVVEVAAGDYVDLVNSQIVSKADIGLAMQAAAATTSIWVGLISRGTGTYTASGIVGKFVFRQS